MTRSLLKPRITLVVDHFVVEVTSNDVVELGGCANFWVYRDIGLRLYFADNLRNIGRAEFSLQWNGGAACIALCLRGVSVICHSRRSGSEGLPEGL